MVCVYGGDYGAGAREARDPCVWIYGGYLHFALDKLDGREEEGGEGS